jgi:xylulokinase
MDCLSRQKQALGEKSVGKYIIAYDLGTGGNKASLYDADGECLSAVFVSYPTLYPRTGWHEQKPMDWWQAVVESTRALLGNLSINRGDIECCAISGHSLGVVPLDRSGTLLRESTPIWSDTRAVAQAGDFFNVVDEGGWYKTTGNGFTRQLYSIFKIMWYRDNEPDMFKRIDKVVGTKDFINYRLTEKIVTDYSYASGTGVYDLTAWDYAQELINASSVPRELFPQIVSSTQIIGELTPAASEELDLPRSVKVVAGGVDNSCMALGARNFREGRVYNSLGSSSWIAVSSQKPLLDEKSRPFVFTHVIPGMFSSATSIFSAGSSFRWVRDTLFRSLVEQAERDDVDTYDLMTAQAMDSPVGANWLVFNPTMAGGTPRDASPNIRGAFMGLDLGHTQADVIRGTMEGIAMGLRMALDALRKLTPLSDEMTLVGGGSASKLWRQIIADVYGMKIVKTNIDQQAAALGAAAVAAVGSGLWPDFSRIDDIHKIESVEHPIPQNQRVYEDILPIYSKARTQLAELGDLIDHLKQKYQGEAK